MDFIVIPIMIPFSISWTLCVLISAIVQKYADNWWWLPVELLNVLLRATGMFLATNMALAIIKAVSIKDILV